MSRSIFFLLLVLIGTVIMTTPSCTNKYNRIVSFQANSPIRDTVNSLFNNLDEGGYVFETPNGNYHQFFVSHETDANRFNQYKKAKKNEACEGDEFDAYYRKNVKIIPSKSPIEKGITAKELYTQLVELEADICKNKELPKDSRLKEEDRNVELKKVYLYTFKRQSDEDYHLLIGTTNKVKTSLFFNVEVSGLSKEGDFGYEALLNTRKTFENYFKIGSACKTNYYRNDFRRNPIPIKLTGSLFYDGEHCKGIERTGPQNWKPSITIKTAWELHPITSIEFYN